MAAKRTGKPGKACLKAKVAVSGAIVGLLVFALVVAGIELALPLQSRVGSTSKTYGYSYSGAKSSSVEFNTSADADDSILLFGSSELSTPASLIPTVPAAVFGKNDYGIDLTYIGEAYDQSLWHVIAAGAYAASGKVTERKVAIIVSPGWFEDGGLDAETFKLRFSYSLYRAFCNNDAISTDTKDYVAKRLKQLGIDDTTINAASGGMIQDRLNDLAFSTMDDLSLRSKLVDVRKGGVDTTNKTAADKVASFAELRKEAKQLGKEACTNNDWGIYDSYYEENIAGRIDELSGRKSAETYTDTPEYEDLTFFLKACKEVGFEPMVIVSPLNGYFYDMEGLSKKARKQCYSRIRTICKKMDVRIADFSDKEYEKYFLNDIVHFGWTGWVDVEEAIYEFAKD